MVQRIDQVCGEKLPLSTVLAGPTIEHLAKELVEGVKDRSALVVKIQGGSRPPFFFLHADLRGGGFYCINLARGLGEDQPFYTLPPYGLDDRPRPPTVEAMAAEYIEMLRAVEPHGPYVLGGLCHGGLVAFEMAQQLQRQGEKTNLVVMVGPVPANTPRLKILHDAACAVEDLLGLGQEKKLFLKLRGRLLDARQFFLHGVRQSREVAGLPLGEQIRWGFRLARRVAGSLKKPVHETSINDLGQSIPEGLQILNRAVATYVRRPYPGRVMFVWPAEEPVNMPDEPTLKWDQVTDKSLGWSQVVRNLEICEVPGGYVTLVTKDINVLVDRMKACLDRAQTNGLHDGASRSVPQNAQRN
jgi:thioesterase domain-containing protein